MGEPHNLVIALTDASVLPPFSPTTNTYVPITCAVDGTIFAASITKGPSGDNGIMCHDVYALTVAAHKLYIGYNASNPVGSIAVETSAGNGYYAVGYITCARSADKELVASPSVVSMLQSREVILRGNNFRATSTYDCMVRMSATEIPFGDRDSDISNSSIRTLATATISGSAKYLSRQKFLACFHHL